MNIRINGEPRVTEASTLPELLSELGIKPHALLVEHNGVALRRDEWEDCLLAEGDTIEFVRIVAGG